MAIVGLPPWRPFACVEEACLWVAAFVDLYNHRHRHSSFKFVTPQQRQSGQAVDICRHRAHVYKQARQRNPRRWPRSTLCWRQPEVVWINLPLRQAKPKQLPLSWVPDQQQSRHLSWQLPEVASIIIHVGIS